MVADIAHGSNRAEYYGIGLDGGNPAGRWGPALGGSVALTPRSF
jgi:hypothetical protein